MSADLKRGRITARIGKSETHALPTTSNTADELNSQTNAKQAILKELCSKYNNLNKELKNKTAATTNSESLLKEAQVLSSSVNAEFDKNVKETDVLQEKLKVYKQQKSQLKHTLEKNETEENRMKTILAEKQNTLEKNTTQNEAAKQKEERSRRKIEDLTERKTKLTEALRKDERVLSELEDYLKKIAKNVFDYQNDLEQIVIGTSEDSTLFQATEASLKEEKRKRSVIQEKLRRNHEEMEKRNRITSTIGKTENRNTDFKELELRIGDIQKEIERVEEKWLHTQNKLQSHEFRLAQVRADASKLQKLEKQLRTKLQMLKMQPTLPIYQGYLKTGKPPSEVKKPQLKLTRPPEKPAVNPYTKDSLKALQQVREKPAPVEREASVTKEASDFLHNEENKRRKMIENAIDTARDSLERQKKDLALKIDEMRLRSDRIERTLKAKKEDLKIKREEHQYFSRKAAEIERKTFEIKMVNEENKRIAEKRKKEQNDQTLVETSQLMLKKGMLEHEINERKVERKKKEREIEEVKHRIHLLFSETARNDKKALETLQASKAEWQTKLDELSAEIEMLQSTLKQAKEANRLVKTELSVVKPYEDIYHEWEALKQEERQLDNQLKTASILKRAHELNEIGSMVFQT